MPHYESMTHAELVQALRTLRADPRLSAPLGDAARLLHEVQVHQVELEMQNRELRESQQLLEESRAWYAELFDLAPIGYFTLDIDGCIQEANLTATGLLRLERTKLVGRSLASFVGAGHRHAWHEHLQTCLAQGTRVTDEIAFSVRQRGPVMMQVVSGMSLRPDGSIAGCRTTISDISAVKQSESMLRFLAEGSEVLASSLEYAQTLAAVVRLAVPILADVCWIDVLDDAGQLRRLEPAFADNPNAVAAKQALQGRVEAGASGADGATLQSQVLRSRRAMQLSGAKQVAEMAGEAERACAATSLMFVPLCTRERAFGVLTFMLLDADRRYGVKELAVAEDLARRAAMAIDNAKLYEAARNAVQSRDDVLAVASHDLRSPLSAIIMAVRSMGMATPKAPEEAVMLRHIERAAQRMHRLVGDLVDVSSIDAGRLSLYQTAHELFDLVTEALQSLSEQAAQHDVSLHSEILDAALRAHCDRDRVLQILSNLIGNAIKFTPPGGSVRVRADVISGQVRVVVVDTGRGIASARLPRLFERYYQEQETASLGRGLGLYISRRLVEAHGGTIWAESMPGAGCRFFFTLPLAAS